MLHPVFEPNRFGLVHWGQLARTATYYITVCEYDQYAASSYSYRVDELEVATTNTITCLRCLALVVGDEDIAHWLARG